MLKVVIIDDEQDAIDNIRDIITEFCPDVEVAGHAGSALEGIKVIRQLNPGLVLLDIEMPHGSGFDMLDSFPEINFDIIFITAYHQYAIKAFKYTAVDYILKPIVIEDLQNAIERVKKKQGSSPEIQKKVNALKENLGGKKPGKLLLSSNTGIDFVDISDIIHVQADRRYSVFYFTSGKRLMVSRNLVEFQELLADRGFFRCHNSHLINIKHVRKFVRDGSYLIMTDGSKIMVATRKKMEFIDFMEKHSLL